MKRFRPKLLTRFRRDRKGATAVEFAIIASALIFLVMGIVELGLMMAAKGVLEDVVFTASRVGKTGYSASGKTQAKTINDAIAKASAGYLDPAKITLTSLAYDGYDNIGKPEPFTDLNSNGKWDAGEPFTDVNGNGTYDKDQGKSGYGSSSQILLYTATYNWPLHTFFLKKLLGSAGTVPLKTSIVVKNEPYE